MKVGDVIYMMNELMYSDIMYGRIVEIKDTTVVIVRLDYLAMGEAQEINKDKVMTLGKLRKTLKQDKQDCARKISKIDTLLNKFK